MCCWMILMKIMMLTCPCRSDMFSEPKYVDSVGFFFLFLNALQWNLHHHSCKKKIKKFHTQIWVGILVSNLAKDLQYNKQLATYWRVYKPLHYFVACMLMYITQLHIMVSVLVIGYLAKHPTLCTCTSCQRRLIYLGIEACGS